MINYYCSVQRKSIFPKTSKLVPYRHFHSQLRMKFAHLFTATVLVTVAAAHPQNYPRSEVEKLNLLSKRCQASVASSNKKRYQQRLSKRAAENSTVTIVTEAPYYDVIQNDTCVLSPEVTWGPYVYPNSYVIS